MPFCGSAGPDALAGFTYPLRQLEYGQDLLLAARRGTTKAVVGDMGYDSNAIVDAVRRLKARVVIPADGGRIKPRRYDKGLYKGRNVVERFWNKVKQSRRVATRYDKLEECYLAFVHMASVFVVLRETKTVHTAYKDPHREKGHRVIPSSTKRSRTSSKFQIVTSPLANPNARRLPSGLNANDHTIPGSGGRRNVSCPVW